MFFWDSGFNEIEFLTRHYLPICRQHFLKYRYLLLTYRQMYAILLRGIVIKEELS